MASALMGGGGGGCSGDGDGGAAGGAGAGPGAPIVAQFGEVGTGEGQFAYPRAIDADADSVWVIDKSARVQRIDSVSGEVRAGWTMPEYLLGKPTGVTISIGPDSQPAVYVPDTHYQRVMVYSTPAKTGEEPSLLAQFGSYGRGPGEFIYPTDVGVLTSKDGRAVERLYVTEYGGNDRVSVFDERDQFLFAFGTFGSGEGGPDAVEFNRPQSIAVDPGRARLIVTDACNHRLGVFDLDGHPIRWIGSDRPGRGPGSFNYPYGLALLPDGDVLVSEFGNHRVQRIDVETGRSEGVYCSMGRAEGEVMNPWGVAVIGSTAYVLDSGNNRVLGLDLSRARGRGRLTDSGKVAAWPSGKGIESTQLQLATGSSRAHFAREFTRRGGPLCHFATGLTLGGVSGGAQ